MAMDKYRTPTEEERRIIERNGIDLERVPMAVTHRSEDVIYLKAYKTGDEISIRQGYRKWENY